MKVWDKTRIELATPVSTVRLASVTRHVTDCATWHGRQSKEQEMNYVKLNTSVTIMTYDAMSSVTVQRRINK